MNNLNMKKTTATMFAVILAISVCAGCSSSDSKSSSKTNSSESTSENGDSKVDIYLDEDGNPYYISEDGEKMILFASVSSDSDDDDSDSYIYGEYDSNGLSFTIPDGWYADDSYGAPMMFLQGDDEDYYNYDETISVVPTSYVFDSETSVTKDIVSTYFDSLVEDGYYTTYEITDTADTTVAGVNATYFDITAAYESYTDDDETTEETFRSRYIVTEGDNSYCIILTSLDTDDSFNMVNEAYESFADTISLPTADEMAEADSDLIELDDDDITLEEDTDEEDDDEIIINDTEDSEE